LTRSTAIHQRDGSCVGAQNKIVRKQKTITQIKSLQLPRRASPLYLYVSICIYTHTHTHTLYQHYVYSPHMDTHTLTLTLFLSLYPSTFLSRPPIPKPPYSPRPLPRTPHTQT
jgi:hypothetical protein